MFVRCLLILIYSDRHLVDTLFLLDDRNRDIASDIKQAT